MNKHLMVSIFIWINLTSCLSQNQKPVYQETYSIGKITGKETFFKMNPQERKIPDSIYQAGGYIPFDKNRARLKLKFFKNGKRIEEKIDSLLPMGIPAMCFYAVDENLNHIIEIPFGLWSGSILRIELQAPARFKTTWTEYEDRAKVFVRNPADTLKLQHITVNCRAQSLVLDRALSKHKGNLITGQLSFTTKDFYKKDKYSGKIDTLSVSGNVIFCFQE